MMAIISPALAANDPSPVPSADSLVAPIYLDIHAVENPEMMPMRTAMITIRKVMRSFESTVPAPLRSAALSSMRAVGEPSQILLAAEPHGTHMGAINLKDS